MDKYKLVPVEPTAEMVKAGYQEWHYDGNPTHIYRAMLAAAPSPEWVSVSERLPTREDADELGRVWVKIDVYDEAILVSAKTVGRKGDTHWMPKPRVTPPEPPKEGE